ncbi:unnamed protein product [Cyclocybe aegerita]|uniref:F-box domain-containing protein n=1 Tax=Cyclocybe aegerita TaxID=1973307 RepID=A0A8S0XF89_CYCAE|nr:unnamed protein product [Cyclocybe aegerita]
MSHFVCKTCGKEGAFGGKYSAIGCATWRKFTSPCPPCVKLDILDRQISETKAFLNHLEAHRGILKTGINEAHDPFTKLLPTEVTSQIFQLCVNEEDLDSGLESWPLHRVPFTLSAVSKRWQAVAKLNTSLWTVIHLRLDPGQTPGLSKETLDDWLSRSSPHPLTIQLHIQYCHSRDFSWRAFCRSIISTLNSYSTRWGGISLKIPENLLPFFQADIPGTPLLRSLSIERTFPGDFGDQDDTTFTFDLKTTLPAPNSVSLSGYQLRVAHIDWSNVTRADISGLTAHEALKMLHLAPEMRECTLRNIDEEGSIHQLHGQNIVHTNLTTLDVHIIIDQISLFFGHLTAPSLKNLSYECPGESLEPVMAFLRRSSCPLITFTLFHEECMLIHDHEHLELLRTVPTLRTLKIYDFDIFDKFFELLEQPNSYDEENDDECLFLPSLTSLFLDCQYGAFKFSWPAIYRMIAARVSPEWKKKGRGVLARVEVHLCFNEGGNGCYIDEESLEGFQRLIDDGVEIVLRNQMPEEDVIAYSKRYHADMKAERMEIRDW